MVETLMLLLELLGTYSMPLSFESPSASSVVFGCDPATNLTALKSMVQYTTSSRDLAFRTAVSYATEGSASPMESLVYAIMGLPMSLGGFGCAKLPQGGMLLNYRVDFDLSARQMSSQMPYAICDCYIPSAKIDLEYNGLYHEQQDARIHDGNRNNGLKAMGITVLVVNRNQVQDLQALEAMARLAHKHAGKRFRYRSNGYRTVQRALLSELRQTLNLT